MKDSLLKNKTFYIMLLFCLVVIGAGVYVNRNEPKSTQTKITEKNVDFTNEASQQKVHSTDKVNNKQNEEKVTSKQLQVKNTKKTEKGTTANEQDKKIESGKTEKNKALEEKNTSLSLQNKNKKQIKVKNANSNEDTNKTEKKSENTVTNTKVLGISTDSKNEIEILTDPLVDGKLLKPYSIRPQYSLTLEEPKMHQAIDIAGKVGQEVRVAANGTVESIFNDHKLGETIIVLHDKNIRTQYSNLNKNVLVKKGQKLKSGDVIGVIGNTARYECMDKPHLHFSVTYTNQVVDPSCYFAESKTATKYKKDPAIDVMSNTENSKVNNKKDSVSSDSSKVDNIEYESVLED